MNRTLWKHSWCYDALRVASEPCSFIDARKVEGPKGAENHDFFSNATQTPNSTFTFCMCVLNQISSVKIFTDVKNESKGCEVQANLFWSTVSGRGTKADIFPGGSSFWRHQNPQGRLVAVKTKLVTFSKNTNDRKKQKSFQRAIALSKPKVPLSVSAQSGPKVRGTNNENHSRKNKWD